MRRLFIIFNLINNKKINQKNSRVNVYDLTGSENVSSRNTWYMVSHTRSKSKPYQIKTVPNQNRTKSKPYQIKTAPNHTVNKNRSNSWCNPYILSRQYTTDGIKNFHHIFINQIIFSPSLYIFNDCTLLYITVHYCTFYYNYLYITTCH